MRCRECKYYYALNQSNSITNIRNCNLFNIRWNYINYQGINKRDCEYLNDEYELNKKGKQKLMEMNI